MKQLLAEAGLTSPVASVEPMSGGVGNTMSLATLEDGTQVVLREYTWGTRAEYLGRHGADTQGRRKEAYLLEKARAAGVPVPVVLAQRQGSDDPDGDVPAMLQTFVRGRSLYEALRDGRADLLQDVGATLRKIHTITFPGQRTGWIAGETVAPNTATWGGFVAAQMQRTTQRVLQAADHSAAIGELLRRLPGGIEPDPPVLVHNDATPGNVMVDDERVTGWCDWESAYVGCATWDLVRMDALVRSWLGMDTTALYDGYGVAPPQPALDASMLACVLWIASISRETPEFVRGYLDDLGAHLGSLLERIA